MTELKTVTQIRRPLTKAVEALERALELAKSGEMTDLGITFATLDQSRHHATVYSESANRFSLIGSISALHQMALTRDLEW